MYNLKRLMSARSKVETVGLVVEYQQSRKKEIVRDSEQQQPVPERSQDTWSTAGGKQFDGCIDGGPSGVRRHTETRIHTYSSD